MSTQAELPKGHPMRDAWEAYRATDKYANTRHWATNPDHVDGSLWAAFIAGYAAAPPAEAPAERGDEALALHWIDRYAAGIDCEPQMDRIREALALAPEDGDWYVSLQGSVCIDWDGNPQRQLSLLLKQDGTVSYAAYVDGHTYRGDAMLIDFTTALPLPAAAPAAPAEGDAYVIETPGGKGLRWSVSEGDKVLATLHTTPRVTGGRDSERMDFVEMSCLLCLDSVSGHPGGNGQRKVAATRKNIDAALQAATGGADHDNGATHD